MQTILVTGASGMVGYHIVKRLLGKGHRVIAFVRPTSHLEQLHALPGSDNLSIVPGDLIEGNSLLQALQGVDILIHAAGMVDPHAPKEQIYRTNVAGTKAALLAAENNGIKHFIHISSLSVITGQHDQYGVNEQAPLVCCGEAYADSKVEAEKIVMSFCQRNSLTVTILRPGFIYGPQEKAWIPRLIENLRSGKAKLIDGGKKQTNLIFVENLVTAIELSILNKQAKNQVFNLTDGEVTTKKELFDFICDNLGFPRITKTIPSPVARFACEAVSCLAPFLPPEIRLKLSCYSRAAFRLAGLNQGFDINKAEQELNYTKRIPFAEGMKTTLEYFKTAYHRTPLEIGKKDMLTTNCFLLSTQAFLSDYCQRHKHPVNAGLHLIGVPLVLASLVQFYAGKTSLACFFLISGYFLQYLGHRIQGNEVGEITLLKKIWGNMKRSNKVG